MKEYRGFYFSDDNYIFVEITNKVENIFGKNLISSVLYQIGYHYGLDEDGNDQTFENYIDKNYDKFIEIKNNYNFDEKIQICGELLIITFINGSVIQLETSEWGSLKRI